jgi:signal transduction histidine kinase
MGAARMRLDPSTRDQETEPMAEVTDGRHERAGRRRRGRRRKDEGLGILELPGDGSGVREAPALAAARRRAEHKVDLLGELLRYCVISGLLLVFIPPAGIAVAFFWGIGLAKKYFSLVAAPRLRRRFIDGEVERELQRKLSGERRALGVAHARSMEELSASIAHEIRNPITAAKSLLQQMGEDPERGENRAYARVALEELARVERSISHLLRFAREEEMRVAELRMVEVVESALALCQDRIARAGVEVRREIDAEGVLRGDAEQLRRALANLLGNALDALEGARTPAPRIDVALGENLAGTEVWVRIRDNGPGLDSDALAKLFRPFHTTKAEGTGLGLAVTRKLVEAHGGSIEAHSEPGAGAEFLITLPKEGATPRP